MLILELVNFLTKNDLTQRMLDLPQVGFDMKNFGTPSITGNNCPGNIFPGKIYPGNIRTAFLHQKFVNPKILGLKLYILGPSIF